MQSQKTSLITKFTHNKNKPNLLITKNPLLITLLKSLLLLSLLSQTFSRKARCYMIPDPTLKSGVSGEVNFSQDSEISSVLIESKIYGATQGKHGFHIHEKNSIQDGCAATGQHFNPSATEHGDLEGLIRHAGDMGNLVSEDGRNIISKMQSRNMTLFGDDSIIGRTCVIHALEDDLGTKDDGASKINGNSGQRLACGIVQTYDPLYSLIFGIIVLLVGFLLAIYYFFYYKKSHGDEGSQSNLADGEVKNI
jgi:Cu-Zn family superoxide dismutase